MPTRRGFDLLIIVLLLWSPAKGLAKMVAARHASQDSPGATKTVAKAANVIL